MRIDGTRLIARSGRSTRTVRIAERLRLSPGINDSTNLETRRMHRSVSFETRRLEQILPGKNDKTVQSIPCLGQIGACAEDAHGRHFNAHFNGEESEDEVVGRL